MVNMREIEQEVQDAEDLTGPLRRLTHTMKSTVGVIRMAASTDYVQAPARELIEDAVARLQEIYRIYEKAAAKIRRRKEDLLLRQNRNNAQNDEFTTPLAD